MKNLNELNSYRVVNKDVIDWYGFQGDHYCGVFDIPFTATGARLRCVASNGGGWDHVSVSLPNRCPNWPEMEHVKRSFFCAHETAMQLHVPTKDHISCHPYCLHIWRPHNMEIPLPPPIMVAPPSHDA